MQIEGTKLMFIMNFSVLDFFRFASSMLQIAQILLSTLKFSFSSSRLWFLFDVQAYTYCKANRLTYF